MIDPIFNMYKVKFTKLDELGLIDFTKKKLRIFISLEDVLKTLVTEKNSNYLHAAGMIGSDINISLISNIINLGQHYRLYCAKHNKDAEVYLYCNYPHDYYKNGDIVNTYRAHYVERVLKNTNAQFLLDRIRNSFDFLEKFVKYINGVYIIKERNIESSLIPYIIMQNNQDESYQNIIVSKGRYDYQYVNHGCTILVPKGPDSYVITKDNVMTKLKESCDVKTTINVPTTFIPFIVSLLGDNYRSIPKIHGIGLASLLKIIETGVGKRLITTNTTNLDMLSEILDPPFRELFKNNYLVTDIILQYLKLSDSEKFNILNQIEDRYDENSLRYLNDKYFMNHPLMIVNTRSEQIVKEEYMGKSLFS
jgi:hypothetical protein